MTYKDPDIENFRQTFQPVVAEFRQKSIAEKRAMFDAQMEAVPLAEGCTIESLDLSNVPAERITHPGAVQGKALLYLHGGGYLYGSLKSYRHLVSRFAVAAHVAAYHLDYRLAPEHPYPAALEDAINAYRRILASGVAPQNLLVGGDSAGGNLAAALLLKAREEGLPQPAGLYLLSPWLDLSAAGQSYDAVGARDPVVSREDIKAYAAAFLNRHRDDPITSPVHADLTGLPPTLIQVGTEEVLLSDSLDLAHHAALAGLDLELHVWPEMPHDWPVFHPIIRAGLAAIEEAGQWMQRRIAAND
jgi:epsilon-lactone hydrolase